MTLIELRDFVQQKQRVSLQDVSNRFHVDAGVVEGMMAIWIQKGRVQRHENVSGSCGSCCACDKELRIYYAWQG